MGAHKGQGYIDRCQICGAELERDHRFRVTLAAEKPETYGNRWGEEVTRITFVSTKILTICKDCHEGFQGFIDGMMDGRPGYGIGTFHTDESDLRR